MFDRSSCDEAMAATAAAAAVAFSPVTIRVKRSRTRMMWLTLLFSSRSTKLRVECVAAVRESERVSEMRAKRR